MAKAFSFDPGKAVEKIATIQKLLHKPCPPSLLDKGKRKKGKVDRRLS
jgi:hypothetical protein